MKRRLMQQPARMPRLGGFGVLRMLPLLLLLIGCTSSITNKTPVAELTDLQISENLEKKLNESMASQAVKYISVNATGQPYNASTRFVPKGMRQLYNLTNMFINFIQDKQAYPKGLISLDKNRQFKIADPLEEWRELVMHYGSLAGIGLAGLLLAAVLPFVGLFFCCCRCVGNCGARSEPFDKKHDHCRKVIHSSFLIVLTTLIMFGVVCAFVTNEYMHDGTRDLPNAAKTSLKDLKLYLSTTKWQVETLLKVNYDQLEGALNSILQASGKIVTEQLKESSHAVSLMNLNDIVAGLDKIRLDLKKMNEITKELRNNAAKLGIRVRKIKLNLFQILKNCTTQDCKDAMHKYKINEMNVKVDFDKYMDRYFPKLPDYDVTSALNNISYLMDDDIVTEVQKGMDQFMNIQKEIQHAVNKTIPVVSASISKAGDSLAEISDKIVKLIDRLNSQIDKDYMPQIDYARRHIDEYSPYRYYLGLGVASVLLTILTCLVFGLLCGICGKRPDGYGDDCCDKGSGACFLMMAVWLIFLLTSALLVVTVVHMVTGVLAERAICEPLKNPNDNRMFELVDEYIQIKRVIYPDNPNADINISHIINSCHKNQTIYKVLKLQYILDVNDLRSYVNRYDINRTILELEKKINLSHDYKIISQSAREKLGQLAQSGLSDIKFYQYTENLKDNITTFNLEQLADQLENLADRLPRGHDYIKVELGKNAVDLRECQEKLVEPMNTLSTQLIDRAVELQEHIKFNHSSMAEAIHSLVDEVDKAQVFISQRGPKYVKMLAAKFGKAFIYQVNNYLDYVINSTLTKVGDCGPLSNAYNATIVSSCNKILDPFNGFWASVGWCLILFMPTIILCVKLSSLYQKSDPYPGPLVETEYLYDAYADRDNVPLAHIHDKKYAHHGRHHHHHGHHGYPESYEGPAVGYTDRERYVDPHHPSSSHHHPDSRYSDHAPNPIPAQGLRPSQKVSSAKQRNSTNSFSVINNKSKNWDFPNGGPPRYQPAAVAPPLSTEYERPPPYYYPGPGERN